MKEGEQYSDLKPFVRSEPYLASLLFRTLLDTFCDVINFECLIIPPREQAVCSNSTGEPKFRPHLKLFRILWRLQDSDDAVQIQIREIISNKMSFIRKSFFLSLLFSKADVLEVFPSFFRVLKRSMKIVQGVTPFCLFSQC